MKTPERDDITEFQLYGGSVKGKFYKNSHRYYLSVRNGPFAQRTGVTTFCGVKDKSVPLGKWQQGLTLDFLLEQIAAGAPIDHEKAIEAVIQHELSLEKSQDIGKAIHAYIEHYIRRKLKQPGFDELPELPDLPEAMTGVNGFYEWEAAHKVKWISTERVVYSKKHDYIGTMDLEALIDGKHGISDFKSSNGLYNQVRMQTAAYTMADVEEKLASNQMPKKLLEVPTKDLYKSRWAIRFSKYTEEEYYKREERKKEIKRFIARFKGKEVKDYDIKPYEVFEAQPLDLDNENLERDFEAFKHAMALYRWDKETDPYANGGSL